MATRDHPHTCGEYFCKILNSVGNWGSPPHLWGIHGADLRAYKRYGITPTPVGNTVVMNRIGEPA